MTAMELMVGREPWVEVRERSDGHVLPFVTGVVICLVSAIVFVLVSGPPV